MRTQVPFGEAPVTIASKRSPMRPSSSVAAADFCTWRSTFALLSSCSVQCRASAVELAVVVRHGLAGERGFQQALRHQIGEAAVRRGRVRVVAHRESEVAVERLARTTDRVFTRAKQLDHRQRQIREAHRDRPARRRTRNVCSADASGSAGSRSPSFRREIDDALPALGGVEDAAERREALRVEPGRGDAVGGDHEVFDHRLRAIVVVGPQVGEHVAFEDRPRLQRLQIERAALMAPRVHRLRRAILQADLILQPRHRRDLRRHRRLAVEPCRDAVVGQLRVIEDVRAKNLRVRHVAGGGHRHRDDDREARFAFVERRDVGRQLFGQHREDACRGVDGRGVGARVLVDRRAIRHRRIHVGDRHEDGDRAVRQRLRDRELIEIARIVVVDRRPEMVAHVAHGRRGLARRTVDRLRLGDRGGRELRRQAVLHHGAAGDVLQVVT